MPRRASTIAMISGRCEVGEVEAIGDGRAAWRRPPMRLRPVRHRLLAAFVGVCGAIARGAVGAHCERLLRAVEAHDGGVAAGLLQRVLRRPANRIAPQIQRRLARSGQAISFRRSAPISVLRAPRPSGLHAWPMPCSRRG